MLQIYTLLRDFMNANVDLFQNLFPFLFLETQCWRTKENVNSHKPWLLVYIFMLYNNKQIILEKKCIWEKKWNANKSSPVCDITLETTDTVPFVGKIRNILFSKANLAEILRSIMCWYTSNQSLSRIKLSVFCYNCS